MRDTGHEIDMQKLGKVTGGGGWLDEDRVACGN